ncbi:MAG: transposase DNA-binding-containing protein, partial [Armatimonadota bacterium]
LSQPQKRRQMMSNESDAGWAAEEFADINLGDKRLDARLVTLCDRFSDSPESLINQACTDWAESKAAYRFFQNDNADADEILAAHRLNTVQRAKPTKQCWLFRIHPTSFTPAT